MGSGERYDSKGKGRGPATARKTGDGQMSTRASATALSLNQFISFPESKAHPGASKASTLRPTRETASYKEHSPSQSRILRPPRSSHPRPLLPCTIRFFCPLVANQRPYRSLRPLLANLFLCATEEGSSPSFEPTRRTRAVDFGTGTPCADLFWTRL